MIKGSCCCGRVQFEITEKPTMMGMCHCSRCRKVGASSLVFVKNEVTTQKARTQDQKNIRSQQATEDDFRSYEIEAFQAAGVAAGFVNVVASSLGYQTGCNRCFDREQIKLILGTNQKVLLMMGVGFKDENRSRRNEHVTDKTIVSYDKPEIKVVHI